jgi:AraC-like DNA-binding protein
MAASSHPAAPLLRVLQEKVLPALEWNAGSRIVIARARRKLLELPPDVRAVPLQRQGQRVAVRSAPDFQRAVLLAAKWPRDGMQELRVPKLMAVAEGSAGFRAGDYILQCPVGTVVFVPPGVPQSDGRISHLETLPPDARRCSLLWMTPMVSGLACRMCHTVDAEHLSGREGEKVFLHHPQTLQIFYMLAEEASETYNAPVFESLLLALMRMALRDIQEKQYLLQEVPPHEEGGRSLAGNSLEQAVQYLNTHYAQPLTLDGVARRFFMSRAQFTRKFREHTGQSFLEFLNAKRLEQAERLLMETDWTAVMIARYVGFGSAAYFHRVFMREKTLSPMQFRDQMRQKEQK